MSQNTVKNQQINFNNFYRCVTNSFKILFGTFKINLQSLEGICTPGTYCKNTLWINTLSEKFGSLEKFQIFGKISYCTEMFRGNGIQKYDFQTDEQTEGRTDMGRC